MNICPDVIRIPSKCIVSKQSLVDGAVFIGAGIDSELYNGWLLRNPDQTTTNLRVRDNFIEKIGLTVSRHRRVNTLNNQLCWVEEMIEFVLPLRVKRTARSNQTLAPSPCLALPAWLQPQLEKT